MRAKVPLQREFNIVAENMRMRDSKSLSCSSKTPCSSKARGCNSHGGSTFTGMGVNVNSTPHEELCYTSSKLFFLFFKIGN